jgi:hypothetical protein
MKRTNKRWTKEEAIKVVELIGKGNDYYAIGQALNRTEKAIQQLMTKHIKLKQSATKRHYRAGESAEDIVTSTGFTGIYKPRADKGIKKAKTATEVAFKVAGYEETLRRVVREEIAAFFEGKAVIETHQAPRKGFGIF